MSPEKSRSIKIWRCITGEVKLITVCLVCLYVLRLSVLHRISPSSLKQVSNIGLALTSYMSDLPMTPQPGNVIRQGFDVQGTEISAYVVGQGRTYLLGNVSPFLVREVPKFSKTVQTIVTAPECSEN